MAIAETEDFNQNLLEKTANAIRNLTIDAVEKAGSGHAGTAMGCAELGAYLYGHFLRITNKNPSWINRDIFILSAGHASLLLYSCLYLSGFKINTNDLASYRQLGSVTPSHPDILKTQGVEASTGLDGQGIAYGVGRSLHNKILEQKMNRQNLTVIDSKIIVLAGDGCFMEGVSGEASSLAGHLNLNNLIIIYDSNKTSLDGFVDESFSENVKMRYESYGWSVLEINGHDLYEMHRVFSSLRMAQNKPYLIIATTHIGQGASTNVGSYKVHNGSLGWSEIQKIKQKLNYPEEPFYVDPNVHSFFRKIIEKNYRRYQRWNEKFLSNPNNTYFIDKLNHLPSMKDIESLLLKTSIDSNLSGRKTSNIIMNTLSRVLPGLYVGSSDLARSDMTFLSNSSVVTRDNFNGLNIKYGVREFAMACIAIGLALSRLIIPVIGTFLAFSDYMRSAIRMAAMMRLKVIFHLTHDSFYLGQDGPTHQPVEQIASLRAIPHLQVIRPSDSNETKMAWVAALKYSGPTALILSRQDLTTFQETDIPYTLGLGKGAYFIKNNSETEICRIFASGSELKLALEVAKDLEEQNISTKVVSMPSWEIFDLQEHDYQLKILGESLLKVAIEAGCDQGWHKYVSDKGIVISINEFGESGRPEDLSKYFGFFKEKITKRVLNELSHRNICSTNV